MKCSEAIAVYRRICASADSGSALPPADQMRAALMIFVRMAVAADRYGRTGLAIRCREMAQAPQLALLQPAPWTPRPNRQRGQR